MTQSNQTYSLLFRVVTDQVSMALAWISVFYIRFYTIFPTTKGIPATVDHLIMLPFVSVIWLTVFLAAGLYRRSGQHRSPLIESLDVIQSCVLATLAFITFNYLYNDYRYSRTTVIGFAALHPLLVILGRSAVRKVLRRLRQYSNPQQSLYIGNGSSLVRALEMPQSNEAQRAVPVGVILVGSDNDDDDSEAAEYKTKLQNLCESRKIPILDIPADWTDFLAANAVESVTIALPHKAYGFLDTHLPEIADQVSDIHLIPDLFRYTRFSTGVKIVRGVPVVSINESPLAGWGSIAKRLVDVFGALVALVLFAPILVLAAILIPLTSRGPILYRQERMGIDGQTFSIFKFRSMPTDAESKSGAVWATEHDNRPTWIGRIIRKTNIDELPQLFNVLMGDMSLVGPRPERPVFVDQFRRRVPGYMLRHKVKAGMTGWAQINGWRGNTSIERRIECDLFYIQNWSIWLDIRIILLTFIRSFIDKNAY